MLAEKNMVIAIKRHKTNKANTGYGKKKSTIKKPIPTPIIDALIITTAFSIIKPVSGRVCRNSAAKHCPHWFI